ncbi:hypothetical protein BCV71DRAFT_176734, partial [Rhizopus microsporus]
EKKRHAWTKYHGHWVSKWKQTIWSVKPRFRMFGNDGKPSVLKKQADRYESCRRLKAVKLGGSNVMI